MDHEEQTIQTLPSEEVRSPERSTGNPRAWMQHPLLIPFSVIVAGGMIAAAIFFNSNAVAGRLQPATSGQLANSLSEAAKNVRPVNETDHALGTAGAPVTIIEFSDFQCPYCQSFHPVLKQIMAEFGGQVRWVYRHFPLSQIHPEALGASIASECVAKLAGNEAFWRFADTIFEQQRQIGTPLFERLAQEAGVSLAAFRTCTASPEPAKRVSDDLDDALNAGGNGTPYVVVLNSKGEAFPFAGSLPYPQVKQIVQKALDPSKQ